MSATARTTFELRIRDRGDGDTRLDLIEGERRREVKAIFSPPATRLHHEQRRTYFAHPRDGRAPTADEVRDTERSMDALGRALGERLCDADYELLEFMNGVEAAGIGSLRVVVESSRPEFLAQPWELLILPDSPYFAAAACASFIRVLPEAADPPRALDCSKERPLRALRVVSRDTERPVALDSPAALRWQQALSTWAGALQPELLVNPGSAALRARLTGGETDVLHFDGALQIVEGQVRFSTDARSEASMADAELYEAALAAGVELLILDLSVLPEAVDSAVLARVASAALEAGIGNVIVLDPPLPAAYARDCFRQLYAQLARGLSSGQASVETRKELQRKYVGAGSDAAAGRPRQVWSALQHYSRRELQCFERAQAEEQPDEAQALAQARAKMLGFREQYLSGNEPNPVDGHALALLNALHEHSAVVMLGARGFGATQAIHASACALLLEARVSFALYWNFDDECYSASDVWQMIGSVSLRASADASDAELAAELASRRALCVFENVDRIFDGELGAQVPGELCALFERLQAARVPCVFGARSERVTRHFGAACVVHLAPLSAAVATEYVWSVLDTSAGADKQAMSAEIVASAQGNLGLLGKLARLSAWQTDAGREFGRLRAARAHGAVDAVALFFEWRWAALRSHWQQLLLVLAQLGDAYCEMWLPSFDAPASHASEQAGRKGTEAGRRVWQALGVPQEERYDSALTALERSGFLVRRAAGRVIDPAARSFLAVLARAESARIELDELVCEGVQRLAVHQARQPQKQILDSLITNRAVWRAHFGAAFRNTHCAAAVNALFALEPLLDRAQLQAEVPIMAQAVLEQLPAERLLELDVADAHGWFRLARKALLPPAQAHTFQAAAKHWRERISDAHWRSSAPTALFDQAALFLHQWYDLKADYAGYRALTLLACSHYEACGDHRKRRYFVQALAACEHELGEKEECGRVEASLLDELAADAEVSRDEHWRVMRAIAAARLRRGDLSGCSRLLERAQALPEGAQAEYELLVAELRLAQEEPVAAMEVLCALWTVALARRQNIDMDRLIALLQRTARELGEARFEELYARCAPHCPAPRELGLIPARVQERAEPVAN